HTARLYYVQRGGAAHVTFTLKVRDVSRSPSTDTEIPVAREKDLHTVPFNLLDVSVDTTSRTALRIYDVDERPDTMVTIVIYTMADDRLIAKRDIGLVPPRTERQPPKPFPAFAGQAEFIDLGSMVRELMPG